MLKDFDAFEAGELGALEVKEEGSTADFAGKGRGEGGERRGGPKVVFEVETHGPEEFFVGMEHMVDESWSEHTAEGMRLGEWSPIHNEGERVWEKRKGVYEENLTLDWFTNSVLKLELEEHVLDVKLRGMRLGRRGE